MIKVLFFAQLKERLNCAEMRLDLDKSLTVQNLKTHLEAQGDIWQECLEDGKVLVAVNQTMATPDTLIHREDEVAFFPPVTGG